MEELLKILGIQDSPFVVTFGAICLAIIGIASFSESLQKLFVLKKEIFPVVEQKYKKIDISRRGFIISVASAGAVIVGGYLLIGFSKVKKVFFLFQSLMKTDTS